MVEHPRYFWEKAEKTGLQYGSDSATRRRNASAPFARRRPWREMTKSLGDGFPSLLPDDGRCWWGSSSNSAGYHDGAALFEGQGQYFGIQRDRSCSAMLGGVTAPVPGSLKHLNTLTSLQQQRSTQQPPRCRRTSSSVSVTACETSVELLGAAEASRLTEVGG